MENSDNRGSDNYCNIHHNFIITGDLTEFLFVVHISIKANG